MYLTNFRLNLITLLFLGLLIDQSRKASCQSESNFESGRLSAITGTDDTSSSSSDQPLLNSTASLIWQPLRATFRPLNRSNQPAPAPPEPLALVSNGDSSSESTGDRSTTGGRSPDRPFISAAQPNSAASNERSFFVPIITTTATPTSGGLFASSSTESPPSFFSQPINVTPAPALSSASSANFDDEDQPTRVPLSRFRPTKSPSVDAISQPANGNLFLNSGSQLSNNNNNNNNNNTTTYRITNDCFECICEASTSCNAQSRCQTSDVRHTRCGMFLISYDQWLETGLSRQLVNREALNRDAAADERAFYECVTKRDCSERLMSIYMQKKAKDCNKDGRIDCYDVAAVHQGGTEQCNSEIFLESQYWSDFNACFGFGRRRRR